MSKKFELLKELGFSDQFIEAIQKVEFDELTCSNIYESTSFLEPISLYPNDLSEIIIDKTVKPLSLMFNSVSK